MRAPAFEYVWEIRNGDAVVRFTVSREGDLTWDDLDAWLRTRREWNRNHPERHVDVMPPRVVAAVVAVKRMFPGAEVVY